MIAATAVDAMSQTAHANELTGDRRKEPTTSSSGTTRAFNCIYHGDYLNQIAFPIGRAMFSYALLQAFSGARVDAVEKILYLKPAVKGDFRCFLSTATGFGTVGVKNGKPFAEVVSGQIPYREIKYTSA